MNSPHDEVEVWWPKDGPAFATRADDLLAARTTRARRCLGPISRYPAGMVVDLGSGIKRLTRIGTGLLMPWSQFVD